MGENTSNESPELLVRHEDVFDSELQTLEKSTEVAYEVVEGMEGPEAKNVYKT